MKLAEILSEVPEHLRHAVCGLLVGLQTNAGPDHPGPSPISSMRYYFNLTAKDGTAEEFAIWVMGTLIGKNLVCRVDIVEAEDDGGALFFLTTEGERLAPQAEEWFVERGNQPLSSH
jgi:hypothetical protein